MHRPAAIACILLASYSLGSHARCGFVSSRTLTYYVGAAQPKSPSAQIISYDDLYSCTRRRSSTIVPIKVADKNKEPALFGKRTEDEDSAEEDNEQSTTNNKPGVFKRIGRSIKSTFGGNKKGDSSDILPPEPGYKPKPLDAIRLKLAMAMSNINLPFQFGSKDEWVVACPKTRIGPGVVVPCVVNGLDIILFASRDGQRLDAFANACPHLGSPFDLATTERKPVAQEKGRRDDGTGDGCVDCIVCPVHQTAFEIQSGQVRGEWCPYPPILGNIM